MAHTRGEGARTWSTLARQGRQPRERLGYGWSQAGCSRPASLALLPHAEPAPFCEWFQELLVRLTLRFRSSVFPLLTLFMMTPYQPVCHSNARPRPNSHSGPDLPAIPDCWCRLYRCLCVCLPLSACQVDLPTNAKFIALRHLALTSGKYNERTWHITGCKAVATIGFVVAPLTLSTPGRYIAMVSQHSLTAGRRHI